MRKKLAIVGCAQTTRDDVDYSDEELDIWVLNESAQKDWCKRADAVLQMHEPAVWMNPLNRGAKDHGDWLMSGNTPIIYMLEAYPEVPKAVRFPREEIVEKLLPNLVVDSERGRKDYFTSTIAYGFALAIYLGYKEVHTYGIELADEEEYREQQPAAQFWTGVAVGRGIKWVSHSKIFDTLLYPLETYIGLPLTTFTEQIATLTPMVDAAKKEYVIQKGETDKAVKRFKESGAGVMEMVESFQARAKAAQKFGILDGAKQENERYHTRAMAMKKVTTDYVFSKHEFKRDQAAIGVKRQETMQQLSGAAKQIEQITNRINPKLFDSNRRHLFDELDKAVEVYIKLAVIVGMYSGAINEDQRFITLMDAARNEKVGNSKSIEVQLPEVGGEMIIPDLIKEVEANR